MKNRTNLTKYKMLAPLYDMFMGNQIFRKARQQAFSEIDSKRGDAILLVGVGTGEDFPYLPPHASITGIDLSPDMLRIAKTKKGDHNINLMQMNAETMNFPNKKFTVIVLNLILSVVEHPEKVLERSLKYLEPGGTLLIFDKFVESNVKPNLIRRALNVITSAIGTDINRDFNEIKNDLPIEIHKQYQTVSGLYTIIVAREKYTTNDISV